MSSSPFILRSDADLLGTFHTKDQRSVVFPEHITYPFPVQYYYTWTESSGVYTYLIFKQHDWDRPLGLVFQKNTSGSRIAPAGMCDWCHSFGAANEIGLMTTTLTRNASGGNWLCLDLSCLEKIEENAMMARRSPEKSMEKLFQKMGEFYQYTRLGRPE